MGHEAGISLLFVIICFGATVIPSWRTRALSRWSVHLGAHSAGCCHQNDTADACAFSVSRVLPALQ
jgi:hypothetical protein